MFKMPEGTFSKLSKFKKLRDLLRHSFIQSDNRISSWTNVTISPLQNFYRQMSHAYQKKYYTIYCNIV